MNDHTDVAMEAAFEEEGQPPQTFINQSPDAPTAEKATATSFFDDEDEDDGFGDFEDVAWEEAPETTTPTDPTPPPLAAAVATSAPIAAASGNQQDVLHLEPAAFLDAATATMARFSPLQHKEKELIRNITTLKGLKNKFPQLRQNGGPSTTSFSWKGSISQARLLHRLNLGPAPVVDPRLSQPPANRAASLRPTSSGSLYTSTAPTVAAFPAPPPPVKQQRSVLAPPPPPPQASSVFVAAAPPPPEPAPIIDPFSDTTDLVDTMIPLTLPAAEVPEGHQQPLDCSAEELLCTEEPLPLVIEEEQQHELGLTLECPQDDQHVDVEASSPPYQNPFMSPRTQETADEKEESEKDASLVVDEKVETEHEEVDTCAYNPFLVDDKEVKEVEHGIKHTSLNDSSLEIENDQIQQEDVDGKIELEEDIQKEFDPFEEAAIAPGVEIIEEEKEWVNPFEVPGEKIPEFADEFEWAAAASPSSAVVEGTTAAAVDADDDIDDVLSLETDSIVVEAEPPVMEALEESQSQAESEREEQGKAPVPLIEESIFIEEESENKAIITVVEEEGITNQEDDDDFDDFCEADATPAAETEKEEEEEVVPTASEVVENLAATLPDLSFMLSDSLVKPTTP